ncbi:alanine racemase [Hellea sp.]|nr:alanine racemase [Hellea sp.]
MSHPPISYSTRPTLRVNLDNLRYNYEAIKARVGTAKIGACVKADAYGLGAAQISRALYGAGCRIFFVATAGEGKILRDSVGPNSAIYVLNGPSPRDKGVLLGAKLKPVINSLEQARFWAQVSGSVNEPPYTAIHIDTGMNRLGFSEEEFKEFARDKKLWNALNPEWVMSHLACAPDSEHPLNAKQLSKFKRAAAQLPMTPLSLANTAGTYLGKPYQFQMVRPGIGLYGGYATTKPEQEDIKTVVTLLAPILQIRNINKGDTLGYNASYTAPRDMQIAVLGAGYADGIPVLSSNKGYATLHDEAVPIVGRVSMDITMVDITDVHMHKEVGGVVVFRGDQLENEASEIGTINYEMLTRLGQRLRRDYGKPEKKETAPKPKSNYQSSKSTRPSTAKTGFQKGGYKKNGGQKRR